MSSNLLPIRSVRNRTLVEARKLSQRKHRVRQDRFLVEGLQLLGMAVDRIRTDAAGDREARVVPVDLFYCEELFVGETASRLLGALTEAGAKPIPAAPHVLETLSERDVSQGLAATFEMGALEASVDEIADLQRDGATLIVVLDRLQDPGNLGTLIRTADAVGADAVVLLEPTVDPFDPKTVRATMGSLFAIPIARTEDPAALRSEFDRAGCPVIGADAGGLSAWEEGVLEGSIALVLGNEARGLSPDVRTIVERTVGLPLRGGAESLNVAIAGGVLMYEWLRVNRASVRGSDRPASPGR